ncbi:RNA-directed DNA polymerase from mobile element jockey-like [Brachionus plicatilis]|uniref:RNA-directed DNA polymerase from mobile element jockey-like n=1 Tax=Brachionus plicatilis TaxID=10195 RepID=A0A3M7SFP1_BRAPC|nr:RNA-directed DNA polymerase from mobile element jockey-like [Brachionus plicatilis]
MDTYSFLSKWLEKIINTKIQTWTESEKIIPLSQSGFRRNKSTQDHILRIYQLIVDGFNRNELT